MSCSNLAGTKTIRKAKPQHRRDYYKCTVPDCSARKYVDEVDETIKVLGHLSVILLINRIVRRYRITESTPIQNKLALSSRSLPQWSKAQT